MRAMDKEARRRLLSLFIEEKDDKIQTQEIERLEMERDCGEGSSGSKVETSKCKIETSSETESGSKSVSECSVEEESEYCSETESDESDCSSQVSVIMRAPKTAVLNWLKGIEVSDDNKAKGANEIGTPRQHSHDREGDDTAAETAVLNWLRGIQGDKNGNASRANNQLGDLTTQLAGDEVTEGGKVTRERCDLKTEITDGKLVPINNGDEDGAETSQKAKSPCLKGSECNHQHSFDFVEEEMTFIINVMPEEPAFQPLYKEHCDGLSLLPDVSETPLTIFAPHRFDQTPESGLAIECETEGLYKKENKKPSLQVENRLSCINEEDESQHGQQLEGESICSPKNMNQIDEDEEVMNMSNIQSCQQNEEVCLLPVNEEEATNKEEEEYGAGKLNGKSKRDPTEKGDDTSQNKVLDIIGDPSCQNGENRDKWRAGETCKNEEPHNTNTDQEASFLPNSLSPSCYELEDVEEHEFEYIEVENKIESFRGSIGFAIFRRKN